MTRSICVVVVKHANRSNLLDPLRKASKLRVPNKRRFDTSLREAPSFNITRIDPYHRFRSSCLVKAAHRLTTYLGRNTRKDVVNRPGSISLDPSAILVVHGVLSPNATSSVQSAECDLAFRWAGF